MGKRLGEPPTVEANGTSSASSEICHFLQLSASSARLRRDIFSNQQLNDIININTFKVDLLRFCRAYVPLSQRRRTVPDERRACRSGCCGDLPQLLIDQPVFGNSGQVYEWPGVLFVSFIGPAGITGEFGSSQFRKNSVLI